MIDDKELIKIAYEMDNVLIATCNKYGISTLSLSAILLARMLIINEETGSVADYRKLLNDAAKTTAPDSITLQ